ncbi:acetylxylan esterase [Rubritalea marina]|uniref:acetylxylan esterase n=1 Tax=Rubritalea marina TaxID=361055 RepID=UPI00036A2032|nr:acetylxylan esterase [Rubritalea marina]
MSGVAVLLGLGGVQAEDGYAAQRKQVEALAKLTEAPAMQPAEGFEAEGALRAIYFDALDWKGKATKVFAWMGLPESASAEQKVPAMVLVHGGGGTAFKAWVKKWNERGYAAISIGVEGQTDIRPEKPKEGRYWMPHEWAGPIRHGIYNDSKPETPLEQQWMYHAVADTILANSLMRSLPEVDAEKVGLMGISWGGVITSTVIGIDDRFAFAIPTYGCGDISQALNQYGRALGKNETYKQVWDPALRLDTVTMPTLWFSWPEDKHFPMDKFASSYGKVAGPHMVSLIPKMGHGHGPPWTKPDSYAFAESVLKEGKPWCQQVQLENKGATFSATFQSTKELDSAQLISTTDTGVSGKRKWVESPATLSGQGFTWKASAEVPEGSTAWFINVKASELTVSSDYQEAK